MPFRNGFRSGFQTYRRRVRAERVPGRRARVRLGFCVPREYCDVLRDSVARRRRARHYTYGDVRPTFPTRNRIVMRTTTRIRVRYHYRYYSVMIYILLSASGRTRCTAVNDVFERTADRRVFRYNVTK